MFTVPFLEPCHSCGGFAEIQTETEYLVLDADHANVGDVVSCSQCECQGVIDIDEDGEKFYFLDELCEICWARILEQVKNRLQLVY